MPSVVFLKYLKITGEGVDSQGKFAYATCVAFGQKYAHLNAKIGGRKE